MGWKSLLLCTLLLPGLGAARDITPTDNRIDRVTVFLDRAEVTRRVSLQLPAGEHTVLVPGLPAQLLEPSLRAGGQGPAGLSIATVETRRVFGIKAAQEQERKLRAQLRSLKDEKEQLNGQGKALDTQAKFIEQLASLPNEQDKNGNRLFTPEKWAVAWQAIGKGVTETNHARITLQQQQRQLDEKIRKVEQELRQIQTGRRDTITAAIQVASTKAGKAVFDLTYQLGGASWSPIYDASLDTDNGALALTQAAHIRQSTGEDWKQAQLTVSTARPSAGAAMPELQPWWINFYRPPEAKQLRKFKSEALEEAPMADEMLAGIMATESKPAEAETRIAQIQSSEFSVKYRIPGRVTVPADNSRQRFVLTKQKLHAKLAARLAPKLDTRAFLYAELDYQGDTPLLPGPWQLQRDGTFVGTQHNKALRPGEALALAFGADSAIEVDYKQLKDERGKQGLISREQRIERRYRIHITNHHKRTLPVTVFDQIPVSRDESIKVTLLEEGTPPSERNIEDRPGVLSWKAMLKPQQKQSIDFGYAVSYPLDRKVPGF
jgi:uncharacterized protein (TIGR02231 family)